ncbi:unnamed protein product [Rotaria magnacalcarata]|uniref:G-protein coupled receptors family 1 profile domain-containing protein n=1 Tax=Rotaria magnacalcarata TaxID=392030 RepID=A0A820C6E2_9BILA|nr:unnamed protein product [Rotaria magnacalcarata]CAF2045072.1 unnamed protein product [Rotaria magnacalcarata]CAF4077698.1 unnamed protein product [Rotaria magnacalcarata]CAF4208934.1 unnamed protein product [Rotaria magnacalcarata]
MISVNLTSIYYDNGFFTVPTEIKNPCPNQRAITRPLLFVHNYSLFIFGSILNIVAFIILMQRSLRCHSTFAYLAFLSLSNGLLSLVRFIHWMSTYYLRIHFENNLYACRFSHFALDFLTHFSLFTLVCVNIDRARTVTRNTPKRQYPNSAFQMVLVKEFIIAIILCVYHFHWLVKFGYEVSDGETQQTICSSDPNRTPIYFLFLSSIYPIFELIIVFCLPLLMNMICTILIVRSLRLRMRTAKRFGPPNPVVTNAEKQKIYQRICEKLSCCFPSTTIISNVYSCFCFQIQFRRHSELRLKMGRTQQSLTKYEEENDASQRRQSSRSASCLSQDNQQMTTASIILHKRQRIRRIRDIHLSAMLITLTILYLICNLPFNFHQTFGRKLYEHNSDACTIKFIHLLLDTLQQTYFSTNFFLYVLTNRRFREAFYAAIMKICTRKQQYLRKRNNQRKKRPIISLNEPAPYFNRVSNEYQIISISTHQNQGNIHSDMELIEVPSFHQRTILRPNDENEFMSKTITLEELSSEG